MRLYRRSGAPIRVKLRASCWTSIGVAVVLCAGIAVFSLLEEYELTDVVARPRRLADSNYWDDPFIDQPYRHASNKYLIFIHIIIIGYMLLGLNTVCDLYFTGALDEMVEKWEIKPDVAGATFMAAGGSAPELFTSLIGAWNESDVGFGTIVGSAVFNVLAVIGCCGIAAKEPIGLSWWPLFRDCTYYILGLSVLAIFAKTGKQIELWEAIVLFIGYIGYCVVMYFNPTLESKFLGKGIQDPVTVLDPPVMPVVADTGSTADEKDKTKNFDDRAISKERHHIKQSQQHWERKSMHVRRPSKEPPVSPGNVVEPQPPSSASSETKLAPPQEAPPDPKQASPPPDDSEEGEEEEEEDDIEALLERPTGLGQQILWGLCLPIYGALYFGIPKPSQDTYAERLRPRCACCKIPIFLATFSVSLIWIGGFSFFLVYCVEVLGEVLGIPIIVMGYTLLAAGTSIPDLVSSMAVARAGEGDMAVSSSIGSNIFDILVGLPIPWMFKIVFIELIGKGKGGYKVFIKSDYIALFVLILVVMVFCVIVCIHLLGWVLNKPLGIAMAALYAVFLVSVLSVEFSCPPRGDGSCDWLKF